MDTSSQNRRGAGLTSAHDGNTFSVTRAKIFVALNSKGGSSKTTTSVIISAALASKREAPDGTIQGLRVALIDVDHQAAATAWLSAAPDHLRLPVDVYSLASAGRSLPSQLEPLSRRYDVLVLDMPPGVSEDVQLAGLHVADLAIIPMRATPPDLRAAMVDTVALIREARKVNPSLQHAVLITMYRKTRVARDVIEVLADSGMPMLHNKIGDRSSFQLASAIGNVPAKMGWAHRAAAAEVELVTAEVRSMLFSGDAK